MRDTPETTETTARTLDVGARVHVRSRYLGEWCGGFVVAEVLNHGCRLRRISDGHDFPDVFPFDDITVERRQHPLQGIRKAQADHR